MRSEAAFETDWAREDWANTARAVIQESLLLPAVRWAASPRVQGAERLRGVPRPAVIAANHASHLDTAIVIAALPPAWRDRLVVGAAADYFFTSKPKGWVAALAIGAFPVDRKRASATSARLAVRLLEEGWSLILFPEGGRSEDGWLGEIQPGAAWAAAKAGRPVVPVWIGGSDRLLPKGGNRLRRGRLDVLIGDPLYPRDGESPRDLNRRLAASLHRLGVEHTTDWWTALRTAEPDASGPEGAEWRRIWARGDAPERPRSGWD